MIGLLPHISLIERQLITFKDVAINTTALTRSRANDSIQSTRLELSLQRRLNLATLLQSLLSLGLNALARLGWLCRRRLTRLLPPTTNVRAIVGFIPSAEGCGVDLNHGGAGKGVRADEFVVGGMIGYDDDTHFAGDTFATPGKVAGFEA